MPAAASCAVVTMPCCGRASVAIAAVASVHFVAIVAPPRATVATFRSYSVRFVPRVAASAIGVTKCTLGGSADSIPPRGPVPSLNAEVETKAAHSRHEAGVRRRKPNGYEAAENPSSTLAQLTTFHQASM